MAQLTSPPINFGGANQPKSQAFVVPFSQMVPPSVIVYTGNIFSVNQFINPPPAPIPPAVALEYDYTTIVAALQNWPEDDDPEFVAAIPEFIKHGELRLLRELGLEIFEVVVTADITSGSANVTKPTNMVAPRDLFYTRNGREIHLTRATSEFVRSYNAAGATGDPKFYAEDGETSWILAPKPNFTAVGGMSARITRRPAGLNTAAPTVKTWLSTHVPDLLLDSILLSAERFLKNDPRWIVTKRDFDLKLSDAKAEVAQLRRVTPEDQLVAREVVRPGNSDAQPQNE